MKLDEPWGGGHILAGLGDIPVVERRLLVIRKRGEEEEEEEETILASSRYQRRRKPIASLKFGRCPKNNFETTELLSSSSCSPSNSAISTCSGEDFNLEEPGWDNLNSHLDNGLNFSDTLGDPSAPI